MWITHSFYIIYLLVDAILEMRRSVHLGVSFTDPADNLTLSTGQLRVNSLEMFAQDCPILLRSSFLILLSIALCMCLQVQDFSTS